MFQSTKSGQLNEYQLSAYLNVLIASRRDIFFGVKIYVSERHIGFVNAEEIAVEFLSFKGIKYV